MISNAILYRISPTWNPDGADVEAALAKAPFVPCGLTQEKSSGWVPPRGEQHGAFLESVGGAWILKLQIETRSVPAEAIRRALDERVQAIEQESGRRPGKKELKDLKEEIRHALLPHAFPKVAGALVWIDRKSRLLLVDASSQPKADEVVTCLVNTFDGLALSLIQTASSPATAMGTWLKAQEPPSQFAFDRDCELKANDESKAVVKYGRHSLEIQQIQDHLAKGMIPTKLRMTWNDRVSFTLTEAGMLKKVVFTDDVFEGRASEEEGFDADVAIFTGEFTELVPAVIEALDGEQDPFSSGTSGGSDE